MKSWPRRLSPISPHQTLAGRREFGSANGSCRPWGCPAGSVKGRALGRGRSLMAAPRVHFPGDMGLRCPRGGGTQLGTQAVPLPRAAPRLLPASHSSPVERWNTPSSRASWVICLSPPHVPVLMTIDCRSTDTCCVCFLGARGSFLGVPCSLLSPLPSLSTPPRLPAPLSQSMGQFLR